MVDSIAIAPAYVGIARREFGWWRGALRVSRIGIRGIRRGMGWVASHAIAIFSGLLAAFWAAVGIVVRQRVAQEVPPDQEGSATMVSALVRHPLWWAGTLAAAAGYVFQALALAHGSLLLVQPLLVSSLLFALPLSARLCHQRINSAEWGWALLLTAALAVFVLVGQPREGHNRPPIRHGLWRWRSPSRWSSPVCSPRGAPPDERARCCWPSRWRCCWA
jgi:drug/metabolite transporter (DMT)-like permease